MAAELERAPGPTPSKPEGPNPGEIASYWIKELESAERHEQKWRDRARKVIERYRDEVGDGEARDEDSSTRYNILYANTEVLKGVMYQKTPVPDVRRRYLDKDPVGREAAKILERSLTYSIDAYDFDHAISSVVEDLLLPGRGTARVKYVPTFAQTPIVDPTTGQPAMGPDGAPQMQQEVVYEEVICEYVEWEMYRYSPAKRWSKVRWTAFGELLSRDDLISQFGADIGGRVELNWKPTGKREGYDDDIYKRALVWQIWSKAKREVVVISTGYKDGPLAVMPDPLRLQDFFPGPRPVYSIVNTNTLIPVPLYVQYQDQAEELNIISERIVVLVDALRRRGAYNGDRTELEKLANAKDNEFIPVADWSALLEKGGLENQWAELPIDGIAKVLVNLYEQRDQCKTIIYEQTGIPDIVRGSSQASETLGAQELKSNYSNLRIDASQGEVQRFIRDLLRIKAEIISEHFSVNTLKQMTGIALPDAQQKQMAQQAVAMAQQIGQPPPPDVMDMASRPTWDEVMQVLKSDKLRGFRVDIETDSTIKPHADKEQRNRIDLLTSLSGFLQTVVPAVAQGMIPKKVATELTLFGVRAFKTGPQLEEVLTQWADGQLEQKMPPQGQPGQPGAAQVNPAVQQAVDDGTARKAQAEAQKAEHAATNEQLKGRRLLQPVMGA